jgi:hypothetical protein
MASVGHAKTADEENIAFAHEDQTSAQEAPQSGVPGRAVIGGVIGTLALAACAALVVAGSWSSAPSTITARSLLDHPLTVDIMTDNVMTLDHRDVSERAALHALAEQVAHNHVAKLRDQKPDLYRKLGSMEVAEGRKSAVLRTLQSLGDLRVHDVRKSIMASIRDTIRESGDHKALKRRLVETLGPQTETMRQLHTKYFAHLPRGPVANGAVLQERHLDQMELVKAFDKIVAQQKSRTQLESIPSRKLQTTEDTDMLDELMSFLSDTFGLDSAELSGPEYSGDDISECVSELLSGDTNTDPTTCIGVFMSSLGV